MSLALSAVADSDRKEVLVGLGRMRGVESPVEGGDPPDAEVSEKGGHHAKHADGIWGAFDPDGVGDTVVGGEDL